MFQLRAGKDEPSHSVMIAFHSRWYDALKDGTLSVVFRKFGPRHFEPEWIYAYLTQPISAIVAKLEVATYQHLRLEDASKLAGKGLMTEQEVMSYGARFTHLFVFGIRSFRMAQTPITFRHLVDNYGFWPDSTFIPLTLQGESDFDELGGFRH